jgi:hypothetical protein
MALEKCCFSERTAHILERLAYGVRSEVASIHENSQLGGKIYFYESNHLKRVFPLKTQKKSQFSKSGSWGTRDLRGTCSPVPQLMPLYSFFFC